MSESENEETRTAADSSRPGARSEIKVDEGVEHSSVMYYLLRDT